MQEKINNYQQKCNEDIKKFANTIQKRKLEENELSELLIDELSEIVDVDVTEVPITDPKDPDRVTGGTRYLVRIAGGQVLADGNDTTTDNIDHCSMCPVGDMPVSLTKACKFF